jgi:hypothetical protein
MLGSAVRRGFTFVLLAPLVAQSADLSHNLAAKSMHLSILGDRLFREARFEESETAYAEALDLDQRNVRAHLGMGKIATLLSEPERAAGHFSAAYQIAPRDPDAILALANVVENVKARQTLFQNFLALASDARVEDVKARLRVAEQVGTMALSVLSSHYQEYRIPLGYGRPAGLMLRAKINGGRELKLMLDTGATGIVLNASAGSEMEFEFLAGAVFWGFGSATPAAGRIAWPASFEAGALKMTNLLLFVSETDLMPEADGIIGLDVFKDFLIRLDPPARTLELTPFPGQAESQSEESPVCRDCMRAYRLGELLLMRGTVNGHADGYFVLDSGSPYSLISRQLVPQDGRFAVFTGAQGGQDVAVPAAPLNIRFGAQHLVDFDYATFDTAEISGRAGTEIAGVIGFSILRNVSLTVDYRDGLVGFGKPHRE